MSAAIKLSSPATREFWEIPVLFEDAHFIALDKPSGLSVLPDPNDAQRPALMKLLHDGIAAGKPWARERTLEYLGDIYRLDLETSGILLLAKNKPALTALSDLFNSGRQLLKLVTLVWGNPPAEHFEVDSALAPHPLKVGSMHVDKNNGKKARTEFSVLEPFSDWTLVECRPFTQRPHQINVHLQSQGLPIVGDERYGGRNLWLSRLKKDFRLKAGREERPLISHPALHAVELTFPHPVTGEMTGIKSEWPKSLRVAVKFLRQFAK